MSNCNDYNDLIRKLQQDKEDLQKRLGESEAARAARQAYTKAEIGPGITVTGADGKPKNIHPDDIDRMLQRLGQEMDSDEVAKTVSEGIATGAKPMGAEGKWSNYDRLIEQVNPADLEDYMKLAEALGTINRELNPKDYALVTRVYDRKRLQREVAKAYRATEGVSERDVEIAMTNGGARFDGLVEEGLRLRIFAHRTKLAALDQFKIIREFMRMLPGAPVPDGLKAETFKAYRLAVAAERHDKFAARRTAQTLRSRQFALKPDQPLEARFDPGEIEDALNMKSDDAKRTDSIGRVMEAVDNRDADGLDELIGNIERGRLDLEGNVNNGYFNRKMMEWSAWTKDSQLTNVMTLMKPGTIANLSSSVFGRVARLFEDAALLTPEGTTFSRQSLKQAWDNNAKAAKFAREHLRFALKDGLLGDSFFEGRMGFGQDPTFDQYLDHHLLNDDEARQAIEILDFPYEKGWSPENIYHNGLIFGKKLQVLTRKQLGSAINQDLPEGRKVPWRPGLRILSASDEAFGMWNELFHLKANLELKVQQMDPRQVLEEVLDTTLDDAARAETKQIFGPNYSREEFDGVKGGMMKNVMDGADWNDAAARAADRDEWTKVQINKNFETVAVEEADVIAWRKANPDEAQDMSNDQIEDMLAAERMMRNPNRTTPEAIDAQQRAAHLRMQGSPGDHTFMPDIGANPAESLDKAVMAARRSHQIDTLMPYWRAPFNGLLFDHRLASFASGDFIKMMSTKLGGGTPTPAVMAKLKASWVMSGTLLALFGALDAAGQIEGGLGKDPMQRNSIMGVPFLGGIPVLNTLFMWKDLKDAFIAGGNSDYDEENVFNKIQQVLGAQLLRGTGLATLNQLVQVMFGDKQSASDLARLSNTIGFVGGGQIPHIGMVRTAERALGVDRGNYYNDGTDSPDQRYVQKQHGFGNDDPIYKIQQDLEALARSALGFTNAGVQRTKRRDWLGYPLGQFNGVDMAKWLPMWPTGMTGGWASSPVYPMLDILGLLDPPGPLRERRLNGIGMSSELQDEYNDIYGSIKGSSILASGQLKNISTTTSFGMNTEIISGMTGVSFKKRTGIATVDMGPFLEPFINGNTVEEALRKFRQSEMYQRMEEDPRTSYGGNKPASEKKRMPAYFMVSKILEHYRIDTHREIVRRGSSADGSAATKDYVARWARTGEITAEEAPGRAVNWLEKLAR